jgi:GNAT superfamily N-acetyltransferase
MPEGERIYYQDDCILIRPMVESDIPLMAEGFALQGHHKPAAQFKSYFLQQREGRRIVFVALFSLEFAGYVTLLPKTDKGPFAGCDIPEINDFNVLEKFQRRGIGTLLMDAAERVAAVLCDKVSLGVGLHSGYGQAQRMYAKRGYIPDGTGVWYGNCPLPPYSECHNDDDLVLYLTKNLPVKNMQGMEGII